MNENTYTRLIQLLSQRPEAIPISEACTWGEGKCNNVGRHHFNEHWLCTECFALALNEYLEELRL